MSELNKNVEVQKGLDDQIKEMRKLIAQSKKKDMQGELKKDGIEAPPPSRKEGKKKKKIKKSKTVTLHADHLAGGDSLDLVPTKDLPATTVGLSGVRRIPPTAATADYRAKMKDLQGVYQQELERQLNLDALMDEYKDKLIEEDNPNLYAKDVEVKLTNLKKKMDPLVHELKAQQFPVATTSARFLSKAGGRLISKHADQLSEMLIDDMLVECVHILNHAESKQQQAKEVTQQKHALGQLMDALDDLRYEQERIKNGIALQNANVLRSGYAGGTHEDDHSSVFVDFVAETHPEVKEYRQMRHLLTHIEQEKVPMILMDTAIVKKVEMHKKTYEDFVHKNNYLQSRNVEGYKVAGNRILEDLVEKEVTQFIKLQEDVAEEIFYNL